MRSFYTPPKSAPTPPSRPGSRQSDLSRAGAAEEKTIKRKTSATILTRAPINRVTAQPSPVSCKSPRTPLRPRDHNVAAVPTRRLAPPMRDPKAAATTMPPDKDHGLSRKPPMPTLAKAANRAPITPKIASKTTPAQHQTVAVATPLARRTPRPESVVNSPSSVGGQDKAEFVSPVSAFLNTNVTPRSGSRQIRVDSSSSTPNGTPNLDKADSWETKSGLGISSSGLDERLRQTPTLSPLSDNGRGVSPSNDSKFFFASDARQAQQQPPTRSAATSQKAAAFFYASGESIGDRQPSAPLLGAAASTQDAAASKFVYANGVPDLLPPLRAASSSSGPGSIVSTASRTPSRPATGPPSAAQPLQRPPSPFKLPPYPVPRSGPPLVAANRGAIVSAPQLAPPIVQSRQQSSETPSRPGPHSRQGSLTMAESPAVVRFVSPLSGSAASSPSTLSNPAVGFASMVQAAEDITEAEDGKFYNGMHSPTKSSHPQEQLDELVINARRERKVQDLEITNASLEAINRSLERQLRKQKAELRQFRRLSRSGRLSLASARTASSSTVEGPLNDPNLGLADLSEEESEPEEEDSAETDMSGSESASGSELRPGIVAKRDARHRKQDEKRLQLDLSKHRQMLIESQKMNQSLKRCLGWTEELIKEGKRALEFQVRVSEVEIGGRVLAPPDDDFDKEDHMSLKDDTIRLRSDSEKPSDLDKGPQQHDRDSGIELPVDGG